MVVGVCGRLTGDDKFGVQIDTPNSRRWPNRDPIQERGGINLYRFARNSAIGYFDPLGWKERPRYSPDAPPNEWPGTETPFGPDAYNCHSFAWHGGQGDPDDPGFNPAMPKWDNSPADDTGRATPLPDDAPNLPGDLVTYGNDTNGDGRLTGEEIQHSGIVTSVDDAGNTLRVTSKWGQAPIYDHFPSDVPPSYGNKREYFRPPRPALPCRGN